MAHALVAVFLFLVSPCGAEQLTLNAGVRAQTTYNDNVHLRDEEDLEHLVQPSFGLEYGLENWTLFGEAKFSVYRYDTLDVLDHEDFDLTLGGEYNPTERFGLSLEGSYRKDHTFESVMEESGDIGTFSVRETFSATPSAMWTVTEKNQLTLSVPVTFVEYGKPDNPDAEVYGANLYWRHLLDDERTSILGYVDYTNRYFDTSTGDINQDVYTLMGGMGYQLTEVLSLEAMAGAGYMESVLTRTGFPDLKTDETFFSFDLSATCTWDRWTFTLSGDRQQSPNTSGESNIRTRVRFDGSYQFTERFNSSLGMGAYENVTESIDSTTERVTYYVSPSMNYRLTEDLSLRLQYRYWETENRDTKQVDQQNRVTLGLDYKYTDIF